MSTHSFASIRGSTTSKQSKATLEKLGDCCGMVRRMSCNIHSWLPPDWVSWVTCYIHNYKQNYLIRSSFQIMAEFRERISTSSSKFTLEETKKIYTKHWLAIKKEFSHCSSSWLIMASKHYFIISIKKAYMLQVKITFRLKFCN